MLDESLHGDHSKIREGDAVVAFSRKNIHAMRALLEEKTGLRCSMVYGKVGATSPQLAVLLSCTDAVLDTRACACSSSCLQRHGVPRLEGSMMRRRVHPPFLLPAMLSAWA